MFLFSISYMGCHPSHWLIFGWWFYGIIWRDEKYLENWTKSEDNRRQITDKNEIFYHGEKGVFFSMFKMRKLGMGMGLMDGYQWIAQQNWFCLKITGNQCEMISKYRGGRPSSSFFWSCQKKMAIVGKMMMDHQDVRYLCSDKPIYIYNLYIYIYVEYIYI